MDVAKDQRASGVSLSLDAFVGDCLLLGVLVGASFEGADSDWGMPWGSGSSLLLVP